MPQHYALTGNIGAGKTTAARLFARLGIPVYYADKRAKELMVTDPELVAGIRAAFGEGAYTADGELDRAYLADRVFGDPGQLARLNALVHPAVGRDGARWRRQQAGAPYTLHEAAITLEIGNAAAYDGVIVVTAPREVRCTRVLARQPGMTERAFAERAARQWPEEQKVAAADHLVHNDGKQLLFPQVLALHQRLLEV